MNYMSITGITIGIAVAVVFIIGLLSYMSSLVKSAYQIKIDIRADMEAHFKKIEDDLAKKSKWMRGELGEDVSRMKQSLEQDSEKRLQEIEQKLRQVITDTDAASRTDRQDIHASLSRLATQIAAAENAITALKDEATRRAAIAKSRRGQERKTSDEVQELADQAAAAIREAASGLLSPSPSETAASDDGTISSASPQVPPEVPSAPKSQRLSFPNFDDETPLSGKV